MSAEVLEPGVDTHAYVTLLAEIRRIVKKTQSAVSYGATPQDLETLAAEVLEASARLFVVARELRRPELMPPRPTLPVKKGNT